jgi:hypothetical protein
MSKLLEHQLITNQKRIFNPKSKEDINLLKVFIRDKRWDNPCPFLLEDMYLSIPDMVKDKYIKYQLGIL